MFSVSCIQVRIVYSWEISAMVALYFTLGGNESSLSDEYASKNVIKNV